MSDDLDVLVVGAGFCGMYALWRLRDEGFRVRAVDAAPGNGGVWHWNSYPGARVDSHWPNYEFSMPEVWRDWYWKERFPGRDELCAYFDHVVEVLGLAPDLDLGRRVVAADYDVDQRRWSTTLDDGTVHRSRHVVLAIGFAAEPYIPDLPGLDRFGGACHHTARWPERGIDLTDLRVGVIGTGASGVQVVQASAGVVGDLTVFQRSPVVAIAMGQRQLSRAEQDDAKAGFPAFFERRRTARGGFGDASRQEARAMDVSDEERRRVYEEAWAAGGLQLWGGTFPDLLFDDDANRTAYDFWRAKTLPRIEDPALAELLAPAEPPYPFGTKRPSLELGYYEAFNQDNVHLVDVRANPIAEVTESGVTTADGAHHDLDVLILATGFDANTGGILRIDLHDTDGRSIRERWARGVDTHLGMAIPGVPNLLMLYGPQSPTAFWNGPTCAEVQGDWLADLMCHLRDRGATRVEASTEAAESWTRTLDGWGERTLLGQADSWYMAANVPGKRRQLLNFPSTELYQQHLDRCAAAGYSGFEID